MRPARDKRSGEPRRQDRQPRLGLRQADLATRIGVSPKTIRNWETGHRTPSGRSHGPIREFLGYDPCPERSSVAEKLGEYRLARGWTRADLAAKLGVRTVTVSRWERGRTRLRREFLARVLALLSTAAASVSAGMRS